VTAYAGCNTISGPARVDAGRLVVDELATTTIGCDKALGEQDNWLTAFLTARPELALNGTTLTLTAGPVIVTMTDRTVVEPDRALVGPRWIVDTLIDGDTASSVPSGITPELVFSADGHVTGSSGCRGLSADYTRMSAGTLVFGPVTVGKRACVPDTVAIDRAVLAALTGSVTIHIEADRLTLTAARGAGLSMTAR
jgi:heat shock protein HslJ